MNKEIELANRKSNASGEIVAVGQDYKKDFVLKEMIPKKMP